MRDPLACALVDIDGLKDENDHGRDAGDALIRAVADVVRAATRESDVVARFGGDEFLVVMPGTHLSGAVALAEAVWRGAQAVELPGRRGAPVSIGVALYPSRDVRTKDALLRAADQALFQAKRDGRNRIAVFQQQGQIYSPALPDLSLE
jgi:diguanylate cyclase (GGDEF)-like protein